MKPICPICSQPFSSRQINKIQKYKHNTIEDGKLICLDCCKALAVVKYHEEENEHTIYHIDLTESDRKAIEWYRNHV